MYLCFKIDLDKAETWQESDLTKLVSRVPIQALSALYCFSLLCGFLAILLSQVILRAGESLLRSLGNVLCQQHVRLKPAPVKPIVKVPLDPGSISA